MIKLLIQCDILRSLLAKWYWLGINKWWNTKQISKKLTCVAMFSEKSKNKNQNCLLITNENVTLKKKVPVVPVVPVFITCTLCFIKL